MVVGVYGGVEGERTIVGVVGVNDGAADERVGAVVT